MDEEKMDDEGKKAEFDSSTEVLKRIAEIIGMLHESSMGLPLTEQKITLEPHQAFLILLDRLYLEGFVKFSKEEREKCNKHQSTIAGIKERWGRDLYNPVIKQTYEGKLMNNKYNVGWLEVMSEAKKFEMCLLELLDKHNFLMKDKPSKRKPH